MLRAIGSALLVWAGSIFIGLLVPWSDVFSPTIPSGGDIPAHPVLMKSLSEALSHGSIIHYSYSFWGGFELFQFYFPLPYLVAVGLSQVLHPNVAFKLVSILGMLALPTAFYYMARLLQLSKPLSFVASILGIFFLFTEAHIMWGANTSSTLAGMIANSWAFVFYVICFGKAFEYRRRNNHRIDIPFVLFIVLTILSHFYGFVMLCILFALFGMKDLFVALRSRVLHRSSVLFHTHALLAVLLMSWWIVPLFHYQPFSAEFGVNWNIRLLDTFRLPEKIAFGIAVFVMLAYCVRFRRDERVIVIFLHFVVFIVLFHAAVLASSSAIINVRLWPSVYFSCFVVLLIALDLMQQFSPRPVFIIALLCLVSLGPTDSILSRTKSWLKWNMEGLEHRPAWQDFKQIIAILNSRPPARLSFESDGDNNAYLGSVRTFEMLPYLTDSEIIEGGIVNSASYPGISYTLQCLTSNTCAGWPRGSIVPKKDLHRAVDFMQTLGIQYHIASSNQSKDLLRSSKLMRSLYQGKYFDLYESNQAPNLVEVYDQAPTVLDAAEPKFLLLALPRLDSTRNAGVVFPDPTAQALPAHWPRPKPSSVINYYRNQWDSNLRVKDRGTADNLTGERNTVIFLTSKDLTDPDVKQTIPTFYVGDDAFHADHFFTLPERDRVAAFVPLIQSSLESSKVWINFSGYKGRYRETGLKPGQDVSIDFKNTAGVETEQIRRRLGISSDGDKLQLLHFDHRGDDRYPYIHVKTQSASLQAQLPGSADIPLPKIITGECKPTIERRFHSLTLHSPCVGKPHLIKYSFYPKWRSDVPIYLGSNGFMLLVPEEETTVLTHQSNLVDYLGYFLTLLGVALTTMTILRHRQ